MKKPKSFRKNILAAHASGMHLISCLGGVPDFMRILALDRIYVPYLYLAH